MLVHDHLRMDRAYEARLRACGLRSVEDVLTRLGERVVAWSRTTDTVFLPARDGGPGFYVKRYFYPRWTSRLRGTFRGTLLGAHRGLAEFRALHTMCRLGIPAVRPVAYGARRVLRFLTACFLITEEVPDACNLTSFARGVQRGTIVLSPAQRAAFARLLAAQVARMHAAGFLHGRLFWRNVLVRMHADDEPEFFFLDARRPRPMRRIAAFSARRREELARLAASAMPFTTRTDRLRFARRYYGAADWKVCVRRDAPTIERRMRRFQRHEAQRIKMNDQFDAWNLALERTEGTGLLWSAGSAPGGS